MPCHDTFALKAQDKTWLKRRSKIRKILLGLLYVVFFSAIGNMPKSVNAQESIQSQKGKVIMYGSIQKFLFTPSIKVYIDGEYLNDLPKGGRLECDIDKDSTLTFKCWFRSNTFDAKKDEVQKIQLSFNRMSGKLEIHVLPQDINNSEVIARLETSSANESMTTIPQESGNEASSKKRVGINDTITGLAVKPAKEAEKVVYHSAQQAPIEVIEKQLPVRGILELATKPAKDATEYINLTKATKQAIPSTTSLAIAESENRMSGKLEIHILPQEVSSANNSQEFLETEAAPIAENTVKSDNSQESLNAVLATKVSDSANSGYADKKTSFENRKGIIDTITGLYVIQAKQSEAVVSGLGNQLKESVIIQDDVNIISKQTSSVSYANADIKILPEPTTDLTSTKPETGKMAWVTGKLSRFFTEKQTAPLNVGAAVCAVLCLCLAFSWNTFTTITFLSVLYYMGVFYLPDTWLWFKSYTFMSILVILAVLEPLPVVGIINFLSPVVAFFIFPAILSSAPPIARWILVVLAVCYLIWINKKLFPIKIILWGAQFLGYIFISWWLEPLIIVVFLLFTLRLCILI